MSKKKKPVLVHSYIREQDGKRVRVAAHRRKKPRPI